MNTPPKTDRQSLETIDQDQTRAETSTPGIVLPPTVKLAQAGTGGISPTISVATEIEGQLKNLEAKLVSQPARPTLGGYEIIDELGRGGMGVVYRAKQKGLDRLVAIKMLLAGEHAGSEHHARFKTEAQAVASLQHPNIVQIYEVGEHNGLPFFSLEFVPGGSLSQKIGGKPQPAAESARLVEAIARAMQVAHQLNIVHRDLKPANILLAFSDHSSASAISLDPARQKLLAEGPLRNAIPKISDFGLAKRLEMHSQQTRSGAIMGSPSYMAPEQARGDIHDVGPLADVYSIGTILYEMLTGRPPFLAASAIDTVSQVVNVEPVPPSRLAANVPRDLETVCLKCLQKDPQKRYATAEALADDLSRFQRGEPIVARPVSEAERLWRWCRRNPWLAFASAASILLLLATTAVSLWSRSSIAAKNVAIQKEKDNATREAEEATKARNIADEKRIEAKEQATVAATTIQTLINEVMTQISDTPTMIPLKKKLLEIAVAASEQLTQTDESTSKEATTMAAHQKLGDLFRQTDETERAYQEFAWVNNEARNRVKIQQGTDASRFNLALTCLTLADAVRERNRDMEACGKLIEEAIALFEDAIALPKQGQGALAAFQVRFMLYEAYNRMAVHQLRLGNPSAAIQHFQKCHELIAQVAREIDDPDQLRLLDDEQKKKATGAGVIIRSNIGPYDASALMGLGGGHFRLGNTEQADSFYLQSLEIREKTFAARPNDPNPKLNLAQTCGSRGDFLMQSGKLDPAEPMCRRSLELLTQIAKADPDRKEYQRILGVAHYRLGQLLKRQGKREESNEQFQSCRAIREKLALDNKENMKRQMDWKLAAAQCGEHADAVQFLTAAESDPKFDVELLVLAARAYAVCSSASDSSVLANTYRDRAFKALRKVLDTGYQDLFTLQMEPDFDSIRDDPRFAQIEMKPPVPSEAP